MSCDGNPKLDINTDNLQGNIWPGLPKEHELFFFFSLTSPDRFRKHLPTLIPHITTAEAAIQDHERIRQHKDQTSDRNANPGLIPLTGVNVGFSAKGLKKLVKDEKDELRSGNFLGGMFADLQGGVAGGEGRDNPDDWEQRFKDLDIDGVILITGDSEQSVRTKLLEVKYLFVGFFKFSSSIAELFTEYGHKRPEPNRRKEHFGYHEHISQPQLEGLDPTPEGQNEPPLIPPGYLITNADQDPAPQPDWATDGSFLVFRKLKQLVPEHSTWLAETAPKNGLTTDQLSARLMGRWKSGAPVCLTPWVDDESLADCNDFDFKPSDSQERCPFAAHIRKSRPRSDLADKYSSAIIRRGIPYGPEVTLEERDYQKTTEDRGMYFLCYQSNIANGFRRIQEQWCNKNTFPAGKKQITGDPGPGEDPICGQPNGPDLFTMGLCDGVGRNVHVDLECSVIPKGGEYFFSPSIKGLMYLSGLPV